MSDEGLRSREQEIKTLLLNNKETIYLLNDTRLNNRINNRFEGFSMIRNDHPSDSSTAGGSAVLIPEDMEFKVIDTKFEETVCIQLINMSRAGVR